MMFLLIAATAPPGKEFVGIVSEYVHGVSHNEAGVHEEVRAWAMRTWAALKRTAKAGSRQTVRPLLHALSTRQLMPVQHLTQCTLPVRTDESCRDGDRYDQRTVTAVDMRWR